MVFFPVSVVGPFLKIDHDRQSMRKECLWPRTTKPLIVPLIVFAPSPTLLVTSASAWARRSGSLFGGSCIRR